MRSRNLRRRRRDARQELVYYAQSDVRGEEPRSGKPEGAAEEERAREHPGPAMGRAVTLIDRVMTGCQSRERREKCGQIENCVNA